MICGMALIFPSLVERKRGRLQAQSHSSLQGLEHTSGPQVSTSGLSWKDLGERITRVHHLHASLWRTGEMGAAVCRDSTGGEIVFKNLCIKHSTYKLKLGMYTHLTFFFP